MNLKHFERLSLIGLIAVISLLFFNYLPLFQFGSFSGVNLDVSLLYIVSAITIGLSIPLLWLNRVRIMQQPALVLFFLFVVISFTSLIWSENQFRGLVTGSFTLLVVTLSSLIYLHIKTLDMHKRIIIRIITVSAILSGALALFQILAEAIGIPTSISLLSSMYTSETFGVARPTGFSLEPQFFGSLLIVPLLWSINLILHKKTSNWWYVAAIALTTLLLLTLSRGALLAGMVGIGVLVATGGSTSRKQLLQVLLIMSISLFSAASIIFAAASINMKNSVSGYEALSGVVSQLSLGKLSLPSDDTTTAPSSTVPMPPIEGNQPVYVPSSTDSRLSMASRAVQLWTRDVGTFMFGVGSGSFGSSTHSIDSAVSEESVVNNTYLEVASETGLIGLLLFVSGLILSAASAIRYRQWLLLSAIIAFSIQWLFFSGSANVIHVWVVIGLAVAAAHIPQSKAKSSLVQ